MRQSVQVSRLTARLQRQPAEAKRGRLAAASRGSACSRSRWHSLQVHRLPDGRNAGVAEEAPLLDRESRIYWNQEMAEWAPDRRGRCARTRIDVSLRALCEHPVLGNDVHADIDAFRADLNPWPRDEFGHVSLRLIAE